MEVLASGHCLTILPAKYPNVFTAYRAHQPTIPQMLICLFLFTPGLRNQIKTPVKEHRRRDDFARFQV